MIIFFIPLVSAISTDYQLSSFLGPEPTIDGVVDETERSAAGKPKEMTIPFSPWYMAGDQLPREIEIGSVHTNNSNLYIYTILKMDVIIEGNITFFFRKMGTLGYYDYKRVSSIPNNSIDGYNTQVDWPYPIDTEYGGTKDSEGKCYITDDSITFELSMPYTSTDTNGYDLNITVNEEVELIFSIRIIYLNGSIETQNSYFWLEEDSWKIIFHETRAVLIPFIGILMGLLVIPLIATKKRGQVCL